MHDATPSLHDKTNYWAQLPIELHHEINGYLSIYDYANLSSTNRFLHNRFFTVALRPDYKKCLETAIADYEATLAGKIGLLMTNLALCFNDPLVYYPMSNKEIFYAVERCRKPKYLVCDQARLKMLKLDSHLMKTKIANGEFDNIELIRKREVVEEIQTELHGPITEVEKDNLNSQLIQDCIFIGFLTIAEAKNLSKYARQSMELKYVQKEIANHRLSKEVFLNFDQIKDWDIYHALDLADQKVIIKNDLLPTIDEAMLYPVQTRILIDHQCIFNAVLDKKITKQTIFELREDQARFAHTIHVGPSTDTVAMLNWIQCLNVEDIKTLTLSWVKWKSITTANQIISKQELFLEIETKHGTENGVEAYFQDVWASKLLSSHGIFQASPDIIRALFLNDLGEQAIAPLVRKNLISAEDILRCSSEKIEILGKYSLTESALLHGYLQSQDIVELSAIQLDNLLASLDIVSVKWTRKNGYLTNQDIKELSTTQIIDKADRLFSEHENDYGLIQWVIKIKQAIFL